MNYRLVNSNAYLMHYGVKGMKWGVRKEYVPKGRRKAKGEFSDFAMQNPEFTTYATMVTAMLAYFGAKRMSDLHKQGWFSEKYTSADVKKCHTTKEEDLQIINKLPGLDQSTVNKLAYVESVKELSKPEQKAVNQVIKDGWMSNCVYCTSAAALRRKGFDVEAKNSPGRGHSHEQTMKWWKGSKIENFMGESEANPRRSQAFHEHTINRESSSKVSDREYIAHMNRTLASQGKGAYGDLRVYGFLSGHSVEYSVDKSGVKIYDNQIKHTYNGVDDFLKHNKQFDPKQSVFIRLDNCEPDLDRMLKEHAVKPRGR